MAEHITWVSRAFWSHYSLPGSCLHHVLTPTLSQHAAGGKSGQRCANNDCLLCSIRGSFSLSFYNLTKRSIKMARVGVRGGGARRLTDSCVGCGHTLASTGVNGNDGISVWLLDVLIGGTLVKWSCVCERVWVDSSMSNKLFLFTLDNHQHTPVSLHSHPNLWAFSAGYGSLPHTQQPLQLCPTD
ncbi:uncharacterized [Tachysurus ichikawai]